MLTVGSLFSGIGGFDLGLERAGMRTVWFCEQDEFCQRVLAKHWPGVPCHPDVRAVVGNADVPRQRGRVDAERVGDVGETGQRTEGLPVLVPQVDVLCGGFPCQDISLAGKGAGIDGARSGLWSEFARLIGELRPSYVVVENVSALLGRGLDRVLGDLAALRFDAEWGVVSAADAGAPHLRKRVWIVAYPRGERCSARSERGTRWLPAVGSEACDQPCFCGQADERRPTRNGALDAGRWLSEPDVGRVAHGIPARVDRLRSLGNALVPQIAEWIGRRIVTYESRRVR
jgi:DNA (cytosine-5)-methyltransferase 1